jgi:DNA-binding NtrC family response regulator
MSAPVIPNIDEAGPYGFDRLVGESLAVTSLRELLRKVAPSPAVTILLTGERGTGKDLVARVLHVNSPRGNRPYVRLASASIAVARLETALFGPDRGTLVLDDVGELPPPLQARLQHALDAEPLDLRVIAATRRDLEGDVARGVFREDLYRRLNVLPIALPPLRAHAEDVPALVAFYVDRFNAELRLRIRGASDAALRALRAYAWPGNVRELRNLVERAMLLTEGTWLDVDHFPELGARTEAPHGLALPDDGVDLEQLERALVVPALDRCRYNQTRAAALLGLNRDQIRYRIEKFGLVRRAGA